MLNKKTSLLFAMIFLFSMLQTISAFDQSKFDFDYTEIGTTIYNVTNQTINQYNTTFNSTQFSSENPATINETWLQSIVELFAPSPDLSAYALISNLVSLLGNWSADKTNYYNKTEIDNLPVNTQYDYLNIDETTWDLCNTADVLTIAGTWAKSNIAVCSAQGTAGTVVGNDLQFILMGTGAGTGTTTSLGINAVASFETIYWKIRSNSDTVNSTTIFGMHKTSVANDMNTLTDMLGFWQNVTTGDLNIYGRSCSASSCTITPTGFVIAKNGQYDLKMVGNQALTRDALGTNYSFYAKATSSASWTYLGYIDATIPSQTANMGYWCERHATGGTIRMILDKVYMRKTSEYYTY